MAEELRQGNRQSKKPYAQEGGLQRHAARGLMVALAVGVGMLGGLGAFTFGYAKGFSYLYDDPEVCINCHVMQGNYDSWLKSSHHSHAICNDCHLPHNFVGKYWVKADNGFFHSMAFTLDDYPRPLRIKARNRRVTQNACLYCHADFVNTMLPLKESGDMLLCIQCHSDVGHAGERRHGEIARP